jgi:hypothetical protein
LRHGVQLLRLFFEFNIVEFVEVLQSGRASVRWELKKKIGALPFIKRERELQPNVYNILTTGTNPVQKIET